MQNLSRDDSRIGTESERDIMLGVRLLADIVVVFHACYVAFVVFGQVAILAGLVLRWRWVRNFWFRTLHLAAIGVVVAQVFLGTSCPLTVLENHLRNQAGQATYPGAFIGYWAHRLIFYRAEPWVFHLGYCLFGLAVLATFVLAPPRWPRRKLDEAREDLVDRSSLSTHDVF